MAKITLPSIESWLDAGYSESDYYIQLEELERENQEAEIEHQRWLDSMTAEERFEYENTRPSAIAKRLKDLRKSKGATQEFIAEWLNVTKQTISNYETGNSAPSSKILDKLCVLYQVPLHYILGTNPPKESAVENEIIGTIDYIKAINRDRYYTQFSNHEPHEIPTEKEWLSGIISNTFKNLTLEQLYQVKDDVLLKSILNINKNDKDDKLKV